MQSPWLAKIDLGGQDAEIRVAVDSLRQQGIEVECINAEDVVHVLGSRVPVLAMAHSRTLTLETLDILRLLTRNEIPAVVIADHLDEEDELALLHSGAWLALGLPMSARLLCARVSTLYGHLKARASDDRDLVRTIGNVTIDLRRREVAVEGKPVTLTKTEFNLLQAFILDPLTVITRERLLHDLDGGAIGPRSLESHVSRLRMKITAAGGPRLIESVRGVGYRLRSS